MPQFKRGDHVAGPSIHDPDKARRWVLLCDPSEGSPAYPLGVTAAQNLAAKRPYRHLLDLTKVTLLKH